MTLRIPYFWHITIGIASLLIMHQADILDRFLLQQVSAPLKKVSRIKLHGEELSYEIALDERSQHWIMKSPEVGLVDRAFATETLNIFQTFEFGTPLKRAHAESKIYGLENPSFVLDLYSDDGSDFQIKFGGRNNYLARRYVQLGSDKTIYAPADVLLPQLVRSPQEIIDFQPLKHLLEHVREVDFGNGLVLQQQEQGWYIGSELADQPFAREFVRRLFYLQTNGYQLNLSNEARKVWEVSASGKWPGQDTSLDFQFFEVQGEQSTFLQIEGLPVTMIVSAREMKRLKPSREILLPGSNS